MKNIKQSYILAKIGQGGAGGAVLLFFAVLAVMLHGVFLPDQTLFSNDGPLAELISRCHRLPDRFTGCWSDLSNVGFNGGAAFPDISYDLLWLLGPVLFSKLYALISLLILGFGSWCFFRQSRLTPLACVLGGLATMLSSTFFSVACWGVGAHDITIGMFFLALAALVDPSSKWIWLRLVLAGMAVGMGVAEGADMGAIFSLYVVAFFIYRVWVAEGSRAKNIAVGVGQLVLIVVCAVFLAAQPVRTLIGTSVNGVIATKHNEDTKLQRWNWATQWSLPKQEILGLAVPGLFGYRTDSTMGAKYWGIIGRDQAWEQYLAGNSPGPAPTGPLRFTGGGNYVGVLVLLVALWAAGQSLLRKNSVFGLPQRKWLWFWLAVGVVSLLLALGRFAPFYQWVYLLPYFSTIRNPVKFLDLFNVAAMVLFAFGVDGLQRRYMTLPDKAPVTRWAGLDGWWQRAPKFEKNWVLGCALVWLASLAAWYIYSGYHDQLKDYLQTQRVTGDLNAVADYSIRQVGWFVLFFLLSAGLMVLIFCRAFAGKPAGGILLGVLLVADLGLANQPWIIYWNYGEKYATNPVLDILRDKPYEHRVVLAPVTLPPKLMMLSQYYRKELLQQQLPYYNIQSFDVVEMSRVPEDFSAFLKAMDRANVRGAYALMRRAWLLTNTRYVMAPADFDRFWNQQDFALQAPLRKVIGFDIEPRLGVSAVTRADQLMMLASASGPYALFEFSDALPRVKLYSHWEINTNDAAVADEIFSPDFDPKSSVIVAGGVPPSAAPAGSDASGGSVDFVSYAPKDLVFKADAGAPSVLLLNDHYDPNWKVFVDGKPAGLLRCNFLMRGVYLLPGTHQVEFKFLPPYKWLFVSLAGEAVALLALGTLFLLIYRNRRAVEVAATAAPGAQPSAPAPNSAPAVSPAAKSSSKKKANRKPVAK